VYTFAETLETSRQKKRDRNLIRFIFSLEYRASQLVCLYFTLSFTLVELLKEMGKLTANLCEQSLRAPFLNPFHELPLLEPENNIPIPANPNLPVWLFLNQEPAAPAVVEVESDVIIEQNTFEIEEPDIEQTNFQKFISFINNLCCCCFN